MTNRGKQAAKKILFKKSSLPKQGSIVSLNSINSQYKIIRSDVNKLRRDVMKGYKLVKEFVDTKLSHKAH